MTTPDRKTHDDFAASEVIRLTRENERLFDALETLCRRLGPEWFEQQRWTVPIEIVEQYYKDR